MVCVETVLGFQPVTRSSNVITLQGTDRFLLSTRDYPLTQIRYKTFLQTEIQGDVKTFVARLLKDGLTYMDKLD
jgi:hypothetical protein